MKFCVNCGTIVRRSQEACSDCGQVVDDPPKEMNRQPSEADIGEKSVDLPKRSTIDARKDKRVGNAWSTVAKIIFGIVAYFIIAYLWFTLEQPLKNWIFATTPDLAIRFFSSTPAENGGYAAVRITESHLDHRGLLADDAFVVTLTGGSHLSGNTDAEFGGLLANSGVAFTVECAPHFWNRCGPLIPTAKYYAQWVTPEHTKLFLAMGDPTAQPTQADEIEHDKWLRERGIQEQRGHGRGIREDTIQVYDVQRWERLTGGTATRNFLPQRGNNDDEQVVEVDVDPNSWANAELTVICSAKAHLLPAYSLNGKGKEVTRNCTIKNLTNKMVQLATFDKVKTLFRLPDGQVVRGDAYLGSNQQEIPAHGQIENAGLFAGKQDCPVAQSDFDCAEARVMKSRELLIADTESGVRYHVIIE